MLHLMRKIWRLLMIRDMTMLLLGFILATLVWLGSGGTVSARDDPDTPFCDFLGQDVEPILGVGAISQLKSQMNKNWKVGRLVKEFKADHNLDVIISIVIPDADPEPSAPGYGFQYFKLDITSEPKTSTSVKLVLKSPIPADLDMENLLFRPDIVCKSKTTQRTLRKLITTIEIEVTNDYSPEFEKAKYIVSLPEDYPVGFMFREQDMEPIVAFDKDTFRDFGELKFQLLDKQTMQTDSTFSLTSVRLNDPSISKYDISLTLTEPFVYETRSEYKLILEAKDPDFNKTCDITIDVKDVDNKDPVFKHTHYKATVDKDQISATEIKLSPSSPIEATDGDTGINETLKFSINADLSDNPEHLSIVDPTPTSCVVSLKNSKKLAEDGIAYFVAFIEATQENNSIRKATTVLKIYLEIADPPVETTTQVTSPSSPVDGNTNTSPSSPVDGNTNTSPSSPVDGNTNTSPSSPVDGNTNTSPSSPVDGNTNTSPSSPVDGNTNTSPSSPVDGNTDTSPSSPVHGNTNTSPSSPAEDSGTTSPDGSTIKITDSICVTQSISPPTAAPTQKPEGFPEQVYTLILASDKERNSTVYTVRAGDGVTYEIEGQGYFGIHPHTGTITLLKSLEGQRKLTVIVQALVNTEKIDTANLEVTISTNTNTSVRFPNPLYDVSIEENAQPQDLLKFTSDPPRSMRYKIIKGDNEKFFSIHTQTSELWTAKELDYEETRMHVLNVKMESESLASPSQESSDSENDVSTMLDNEAVVVVHVIDVNERPQFDHSTRTLWVGIASFHKPAQTYMLPEAIDVDEGDNGKLVYSLLNLSSTFDVIPAYGNLLFEKRPDPSEKRITLTLVASDNGQPPLTDNLPFEVFFVEDQEMFIISVEIAGRAKRSTTMNKPSDHQAVLDKLADVLNIEVGLVQYLRNTTDSKFADLYLFARKDGAVLKFDDIKKLTEEKHTDLEGQIGRYEIVSPDVLGIFEKQDDKKTPDGMTIAVYILSAVVFALVAAAIGLFIFNRWSKANRRRMVDSIDDGGNKEENQKIDDASEAIHYNEYQKGNGVVRPELAADTYVIDTDDRVPVLQERLSEDAECGIENGNIKNMDITRKTDQDEQSVASTLPEEGSAKERQDVSDQLPKKLDAWPALLELDAKDRGADTSSPVTDFDMVEPVLSSSSEDFKNFGVSKEDQLQTINSEEEAAETVSTLPVIGVDKVTELPMSPIVEENSSTEVESAEIKPLKKCLKTNTQPEPGRRKSVVSFNETAEVITVIEEASSKL